MTISEIIANARKGRSQKEFAEYLGKSQSVISKYESGRTNPPVDVIEKCLKIHNMNKDISAEELASMIKDKLSNNKHKEIRVSIANLIKNI